MSVRSLSLAVLFIAGCASKDVPENASVLGTRVDRDELEQSEELTVIATGDELQKKGMSVGDFFAQYVNKMLAELKAPNPNYGAYRRDVEKAVRKAPLEIMSKDDSQLTVRSSDPERQNMLIIYTFNGKRFSGTELKWL